MPKIEKSDFSPNPKSIKFISLKIINFLKIDITYIILVATRKYIFYLEEKYIYSNQ